MFSIDHMSRRPVYEQLIDQVETFILKGILSPGDQMPSVRSLSLELSVNPNTVQKSYSELDLRGIIHSVPGKGCFVSDEALIAIEAKKRAWLGEFRAKIEELKLAGISKEELDLIIDQIYEARGAEK